jgi:hypothetical protein
MSCAEHKCRWKYAQLLGFFVFQEPTVNEDQTPQDGIEPREVHIEKICQGEPVGPQKKHRVNYDGSEPLDFPGHEAVAQFLATPATYREFDSVVALSKHFKVSRMTVHRWTKNIDVFRRADWLSMQNKGNGKLIIRRELAEIMEKLVEKAKQGDVKAIKLCIDLAYPEDKQREKSGLSSQSLEEVLERAEIEQEKHAAMMTPTWIREREERMKAAKRQEAEKHPPQEEPKDKPD